MMTLRIDPACDALYAHYYVTGANMLACKPRVIFDPGPFGIFKHTKDYVPLVVETTHNGMRKVVIDFGDTPTFRKEVYEWADVYAKVNLTAQNFENYAKMLPIGPASLGVRIFPKWAMPWLAIKHYLRARTRIPLASEFLASYRANLRRLTYEGYRLPLPSSSDYVHFVSTLWKNDQVANQFRVNFMNAVRNVPGIRFEGGFVPRADGQTLGYDPYIGSAFESLETYREKIGRSFVVFNTPAVKQCHGWKLPEYMAWGKAIISTPPARMFPEPLVDGEHWLLTDGSVGDIESKIRMLQADPALHARLQKNARAYFDKYLRPDAVMLRIFESAGLIP